MENIVTDRCQKMQKQYPSDFSGDNKIVHKVELHYIAIRYI
jgi:hypothetical protein